MTPLPPSPELAPNFIQVELLLFASAVELAGSRRLVLQVPNPCRIDQFVEIVKELHPELKSLIAISRWAVDEQFVPSNFVMVGDLTLAMIPPVSGG